MKITSEDIQKGTPTEAGLYLCYIKSDQLPKDFPYCDKKLLIFSGDKFYYRSSTESYRGEILGWIGPIPAMKIEDLKNGSNTKS